MLKRREHVSELLGHVDAICTDGWSKDDRIDRILFRAQLEGVDFFDRRLNPSNRIRSSTSTSAATRSSPC